MSEDMYEHKVVVEPELCGLISIIRNDNRMRDPLLPVEAWLLNNATGKYKDYVDFGDLSNFEKLPLEEFKHHLANPIHYVTFEKKEDAINFKMMWV